MILRVTVCQAKTLQQPSLKRTRIITNDIPSKQQVHIYTAESHAQLTPEGKLYLKQNRRNNSLYAIWCVNSDHSIIIEYCKEK